MATKHHPARDHATALLRCLRANACQPGDVIMAKTMQARYRDICDFCGWLPLPWSGPQGVGKYLRLLCGGKKPYRDVHADNCAAGPLFRSERVYILPQWDQLDAQVGTA
jgi:hypothetical protein